MELIDRLFHAGVLYAVVSVLFLFATWFFLDMVKVVISQLDEIISLLRKIQILLKSIVLKERRNRVTVTNKTRIISDRSKGKNEK